MDYEERKLHLTKPNSSYELLKECEKLNQMTEETLKESKLQFNIRSNLNYTTFKKRVKNVLENKSSVPSFIKSFMKDKILLCPFKKNIFPILQRLNIEKNESSNAKDNIDNALKYSRTTDTKTLSDSEKDISNQKLGTIDTETLNRLSKSAKTLDLEKEYSEGEKTNTDKRIKSIYKKLQREKISHFVRFIKGEDFNKTVENLFDVSFLIKNGDAMLTMREGRPTIVVASLDKINKKDIVYRQGVISLSSRDWEEILALSSEKQ